MAHNKNYYTEIAKTKQEPRYLVGKLCPDCDSQLGAIYPDRAWCINPKCNFGRLYLIGNGVHDLETTHNLINMSGGTKEELMKQFEEQNTPRMFGAKGLSSTEASHVANFLKEQVKEIDVTPDNFKVMTSEGVRGMSTFRLDDNEAIDNWDEKLLMKARLFSLSAWLKEAIKLKESLVTKERAILFDESVVTGLKEYPKLALSPELTMDAFFLNNMDVKQQSDYLTAQATASHVGQFVHNFDEIRDKLKNYKPTTFEALSPTETMTVTNTLLYDKGGLMEKFEKLQSIHREAEKTVNFFKAQHKNWVADEQNKLAVAVLDYRREDAVIRRENSAIVQKFSSEFEVAKTNRIKELSKLRIVIPNDLQPILDEVNEKLKQK